VAVLHVPDSVTSRRKFENCFVVLSKSIMPSERLSPV
jgi:hypothetical protein